MTTDKTVEQVAQRLEQYDGEQYETTACYNGLRDEAASIIRAQAAEIEAAKARIAELEAALENAENAARSSIRRAVVASK